MGLLEQLGLSRSAPQPVGHELETSGRSEEEGSPWGRWGIRIGLFLALVFTTVMAFPRGEVYEYTVQEGDTWRQPTLVAPFDFPIYVDQAEVQARRDTVRQSTPPYFREVTSARQELMANRDTLSRQLDRILDSYASFRYHEAQNEQTRAREDSIRFVRLRRNALVRLTASQWSVLAEGYASQVQELSGERRAQEPTSERRLDDQLLERAYKLGAQLLGVGVLDRPRDSIRTGVLIVRNKEERVQRTVEKDNLYGLDEAYSYVQDQLQREYQNTPELARIAFAFFRDIFQPSLQYMRTETRQERDRRAQNVTQIQGGVEQGEPIVRQGEIVTEEVKQKLTSLERAKNTRSGYPRILNQALGEGFFALIVFAFFFFYLYLLRSEVWWEDRSMVLISLLMGFIIGLLGVVVRFPWIHLYAVPVALASVLLTIIFNSRIGLFGTLILAFIGGQMLGLDLEYTLATFFAGAFGIFSVRDIKNRGQFFVSAGLVFVGYLLMITASWLYLGTPTGRLGEELIFAAIGSSFTITASLFLWALERTFDITTDLTLLELSDTNNQLLKELSLRAPGTFNHTLQVANLAEAAADRIGAHTLLTRVGALYHDIGKMLKPEYFVENQRTGTNPHDRLKPRMSALIIASHVKEGIEMGKEYNLPQRVLTSIPTHHGTARIEYFYQKAVGRSDDHDAPVLESEFRYPGPKPHSKETGILMLADSVEAASRSLDDPSHKRLKSLIDLIFQERIEDGQLDDTNLTFRDLSLIKDTFLKMLLGIYHVRVKYPDQEGAETEEEPPEVVSAETEDPYEGVSIVVSADAWEEEETDESGQLDSAEMPGVRDPRDPRPELAEASPHYRADQKGEENRPQPPDMPDIEPTPSRDHPPALQKRAEDEDDESVPEKEGETDRDEQS